MEASGHLWIWLAVLSALFQAIRTAAQKELNATLSALGTTYVRSLFGLPVLALHLAALLAWAGGGVPAVAAPFWMHTTLGALAQALATALLIVLFRWRSFAVASTLVKLDLVVMAVLGAVFFSEQLSLAGLAALAVAGGGAFLLMAARPAAGAGGDPAGHASVWLSPATGVALSAAVLFALANLFFREATLALGDGSFAWRAAWTVLLANLLQTVLIGAWIALMEPHTFPAMRRQLRPCLFVGVTSALGSIGWFTAFAQANASYVRAVGQIEAVFTLLISWWYFRERLSSLEVAGIAVTVLGIVLFRFVT